MGIIDQLKITPHKSINYGAREIRDEIYRNACNIIWRDKIIPQYLLNMQ